MAVNSGIDADRITEAVTALASEGMIEPSSGGWSLSVDR